MNPRTKLLLTSILVVAFVSLMIVAVTIGTLYRVSLNQRRTDLGHIVRSRARLMEAVARAELAANENDPARAVAVTLKLFADAHERFQEIGETGEFTIAKREGDQIVFLSSHRHAERREVQPVPWDSQLAEPMRRALSGQSGTVIGLDYRGETVVAAYEPIADLNWGIVAKVDLAEVRAPFVRAGLLTGAAALLVTVVGIVVLIRASKPLMDRLEGADVAVRESEQRFRELFEHAHDLIQAVTAEGRFLYVNPAWCRTLGYSADEIDSLTMFDVIHPDCLDHCMKLFQRVMSGEDVGTVEAVFQTKDGQPVLVEGHASCQFDEYGRPIATRGIFHDVTFNRKAQDLLRNEASARQLRLDDMTAHAAEMEIARDRAESADRVKSAFLATMSHELRTPLNSIIGFTGILLQGLAGPLNDEQAKQLGMVQGSARHLLSLINDILDLSKIEAGQLDVEAKPFNLAETIDRAVKTSMPAAERKNLELRMDVAPDIGEVVGDKRRVEQILLNLINNAVKFTQTGEVKVTCERIEGNFVMRVTDTGLGIKPDDMDALFEPFQQLDSGTNRAQEGTGLGLAICRRLAGLMGGDISVESTLGAGSTFTFKLPSGAAADSGRHFASD